MKSVQNMVMERLESIAEDLGIDVVASHAWTNIGTISFLPPDSMAPVLAIIHFDFQPGTTTLDFVDHETGKYVDGEKSWEPWHEACHGGRHPSGYCKHLEQVEARLHCIKREIVFRIDQLDVTTRKERA